MRVWDVPDPAAPPTLRSALLSDAAQDEGGSEPQLGTGQGLAHRITPKDDRVRELKKWAAKPDEGGVIPSLADLQAGPAKAGTADEYADCAVAAWRAFRVKLDQCVHYAECRLCELVTLLT